MHFGPSEVKERVRGMSKPVRQHTVPKVYLQRFSNPQGMLHIYDAEKKQYRQQRPKEVTIEKNFYTVTSPDGSKDYVIEEILSEFIETKFGVVMDRFLETGKLEKEDKEYLALFVAFQHLRTPKYREKHSAFLQNAHNKVSKLLLKTHKAHFGKTDFTQQISEEALDEIIDLYENDRVRLEHPPETHLKFMMEFANQEAYILCQQNWYFLRPSKGSKFLTSDHPFYMTRPRDLPEWQGVGLITHGSAKIIPLSPDVCLAIKNDGNKEISITLTREQVREINLMTASSSKRFIIAPDKSLLERVVKSVEHRRSQRKLKKEPNI